MEPLKIGINGFGRIGKNVWHLLLDDKDMDVCAINHPGIDVEQFLYMAQNDSLLHYKNIELKSGEGYVILKKFDIWKKIWIFSQASPSDIEWEKAEIDVVIDSSGKFKKREELEKHSGVGLIVLTGPPSGDDMEVIINGFSHYWNDNVISCGSCTTNCLVPLLDLVNNVFGIEFANFLTVHATTPSQSVSDRKNLKDWRLGRNAYQNIIPTSTGASSMVKKCFPELIGKVQGSAVRVPIENGSFLEINFETKKNIDLEILFELMSRHDIIELSTNKNVSSDIKKLDKICVVDKDLVKAYDKKHLKIGAWYNNEAGYVRQLLEVLRKKYC
jgi:glyceraldehyde 3-phosphate dehydrogenase